MDIFEKMLHSTTVEVHNIISTVIHRFYIKVLGLQLQSNMKNRIIYTDPKLKFPTQYIFDANGIYFRATCKDEVCNNDGEYKYFMYHLNKNRKNIKYVKPLAKQMYYMIKLIIKYRITHGKTVGVVQDSETLYNFFRKKSNFYVGLDHYYAVRFLLSKRQTVIHQHMNTSMNTKE